MLWLSLRHLSFNQLAEIKINVVAPLLPPLRADHISLLVLDTDYAHELVCCFSHLPVLLKVLLEAIDYDFSFLLSCHVFAKVATCLLRHRPSALAKLVVVLALTVLDVASETYFDVRA